MDAGIKLESEIDDENFHVLATQASPYHLPKLQTCRRLQSNSSPVSKKHSQTRKKRKLSQSPQDEVTVGCTNNPLQDDELSVKMDLEPLDDEDLEYLAAAEAMEVQMGSPEDNTCTALTSSYDLLREHSYSKLSCGENEVIIYDSDPELQMVIEEEALEFSKLNSESTHLSDSDDEVDKNYSKILQNMTAEDMTNDQLLCKCLLCQRVWNETEPFLRHLADKHSSVPYLYVVEIDDILKITSTSKMDKQYLNHALVIECETAAVLYKCSKCFDLLRNYNHFGDHMQETHNEDISKYAKIDTHSCKCCLWEYISNEEYLTHGKDRKRNCPMCGVVFNSCMRMGDHLLKNVCVDMLYCPCGQMGEPAFHMVDHAIICPLMPDTNDTLHCPCGFFGTWEVTGKHFKTCQKYNGNNDCYICIICNAGFFDLGRLTIHWSVMHDQCGTAKVCATLTKEGFHCVLCGIFFAHSFDFLPHMQLVHKKKASYPCMDCLTLFDTLPELYKHTVFRESLPIRFICFCGEFLRKSCQLNTMHAGCRDIWKASRENVDAVAKITNTSQAIQTENSLENRKSYGSRTSKSYASTKNYKAAPTDDKVCQFCQKYFPDFRTLQEHMNMSQLEEECAGCGVRMFPSHLPPRCAAEAAMIRCKCPDRKSDSASYAVDERSAGIDDTDSEEDNRLVIDDPSTSMTREKEAEGETANTIAKVGVSKKSRIKNVKPSNGRNQRKVATTSNDNNTYTSGSNNLVEIDIVKTETDIHGFSNSEVESQEIFSVNPNTTSFSAYSTDIKIEIKTEPESDNEADMVLDVKIKEEANQEDIQDEFAQVGDESTIFKFQCKGCKLGAMTLKAYIPHYQNHGLKMGQCVLCRAMCSNKSKNETSLLNHLLCHVATNYNIEWRHLQKYLTSALKPAVYTCSFCDQVLSSDELYQHWEGHYLPRMKEMVVPKLFELKMSIPSLRKHQISRRGRKATPKARSSTRLPARSSTRLLTRSSTRLPTRSSKTTDHLLSPRGTRNLDQRRAPHSTTGLEAVPLSTQDMLETINLLVTTSKRVQKCNVCDKLFNRQFDLKRHLVEHLVEDIVASPNFSGVYICQICQDKYTHVLQFKRHIRDHANLTVYQCEICDKAFADSSNFCKHKKVHNIICMQCDTCGRKFTSKRMLEKHMKYHSNTQPVHCPFCERYFYFESGLKKHITWAHSKKGGTKFKCPVCLHRCDSMKTKWDHMWKEHHIRSVEADCPFCEDVGFRKKRDLLNHLRKEHPVISKKRLIKPSQAVARAVAASRGVATARAVAPVDQMDEVGEIDVPSTEAPRHPLVKASGGSEDPEQLLLKWIVEKGEAVADVPGVPSHFCLPRPRILKPYVKTIKTAWPPQDGAPKCDNGEALRGQFHSKQ